MTKHTHIYIYIHVYVRYKRILVNMLKHNVIKRLTEMNHDKYIQQIMMENV
jgi:hypothetical protein